MAQTLMRPIAVGFALALLSAAANAQTSSTLRGTVTDAATGRPVAGAIVRIAAGQADRVTRTDERGAFVFAGLGNGVLNLSVRNLGFEPHLEAVEIATDRAPLAILLRRIQALDTVRVRAAKQGLFGVVATASDLRPLPNAKLRIIGIGGGPVSLDSGAHFFVPVKTVGSYVLRATAPGFLDQTISVIVAPNDGVEVAFLLDSAINGVSHRLELPYVEFDERLKRRGLASALVPRSELMKNSTTTLVHALRYSQAFRSRNLRWDYTACVFVDGRARSGMSLNAIMPEDVEAVEVYAEPSDKSMKGDRTGTLLGAWRPSYVCGDTGVPGPAPGGKRDDVIRWVVIWLKP